MRKLLIGLALLVLAACGYSNGERVQLSGKTEQRPVQVAAFDKVELKGPDRVVVRVGAAQSVAIEGDSAVLALIEVAVEDGRLVVKRKNRYSNVSGDKERATVTIAVPRLAGAAVGGSGDMSVDRVGGGDFSAAVGGSGELRVGQAQAGKIEAAVGGSGDLRFERVEANSVEMAIGGSGTIGIAGRAQSVEVAIGGSGDIEAAGLATRTAEIAIAGSGNAAVNASETAKISIAGSGDVTVSGGARCTTSKIGSGNVRCGTAG